MTTQAEHEALVRWIQEPESYATGPARVQHMETHISDVFLVGRDVFKLKKPVRYDFLDFSTVAAREHACREELRLNRRLAPDAYLGVVPITTTTDGKYQIGGDGPPIDWLVHMRRLPTEMTLDSLLARGELAPEHIDRLSDVLVRFYQSLAPLPMTPPEYRERCLAHVRGNLRELISVKHHLPRGIVERVHNVQLQFLLLQPEIVEQRAADGRIVDGHGDLRPEHICLGNDVVIFDCIEFSAEFRSIDAADELAFLAAECDCLGADWIGPRLFAAYERQTRDRPPPMLVDFYKSYRACVRAKVAALRADQLHGAEQNKLAAEASRHLGFADRYSSPWLRPLVLVVGGLSGTGKTTLATLLAEAFGAELLRTDIIRQQLFAAPEQAAIDGGIYSPAQRERVYDELLRRAAAFHADRISVVLDGTFSAAELLRRAWSQMVDPRSIFLAVECICPPAIAQDRISRRLAAGRDASAARPEIYDVQQRHWESWPREIPHIRIDTTTPPESQLDLVLAKLSKPG
jgi:uncharacterized protein